ncbi:MAG: hypothetical protein DRP79_02365 [Planctomycetota bacterium]|nr:MAG: hypothetical protein DRP79_02365 [Planctomycetota bacterium]
MNRLCILLLLPVLVLFVTAAFAAEHPPDDTARSVTAYLQGNDDERAEAFAALYKSRDTSVERILERIESEEDPSRRTALLALVERINHKRNQEQDGILGMLTDYSLKESHFWMVLILSVGLFVVVIDLVRRKLLRIEYSWLWVVSGAAILFLVLSRLLDVVAGLIGARVPQALFFMGVVFLTLINVHYSVAISRLTNRSKNLSQELAVLKSEFETAVDEAGRAGSNGGHP